MNAPQQHQPGTSLTVRDSDVLPFTYGDTQVRTMTIDDEPWFVAGDVCAALDISDVRRAVSRLDQDDRRQAPVVDRRGRTQPNTWMINESGLYALILRSDKEEARRFQRWVTREVLPAIRRTGSYSTAPVPAPRSQLDVLRAALDEIAAAQEQAARAEQRAIAAEEISAKTDARLDAIEGKHEWFAALGYAKLNGWQTDRVWLQRLGKRAGAIGRANGIQASKVQHGLYGEVNQWPAWCWDQAYDDMGDH